MDLQRRALLLFAGGLLAASCGSTASPEPASTVNAAESAVQVVAVGCRSVDVHGAGLMVADGRIATVAHVVAGATQIEVRGVHGTAAATVVYFDPVLDLAVLKVDPRLAAPVPIGTAASGDQGTVVVYRDDAPVALPAEVRRLVQINTADIYGLGQHLRPGYELGLDIRPGDSGAVVVVGGKAVALLWATSKEAAARTWAMRASLLTDHLSDSAPVDNGHCT
ncbi:MAG: trypsin-like peptidase domain-containing protein [Ilumatobacteraceae bacterium]